MPDLPISFRPALMGLVCLGLAACGDTPDAVELATQDDASTLVVTTETPDAAAPTAAPATTPPSASNLPADMDGAVVIEVDRLISEDAACLVMMNVANGTDQTVTAGMFAFDVTGNGESAGANMFPQTAEPGAVTTAQIILPGADCADAKVIEGGQLNCRIVDTEESCVDVLEVRDGEIDFTLND